MKEQEGTIPNFNISVGITDDFMLAVKGNRKHQLINPKTGAVTKEIDANELKELVADIKFSSRTYKLTTV